MNSKVISILFVVVALVLGLLVTFLPHDQLAQIVYVERFFDVMIPVLAVGALVKYLFFSGQNK